MLEMNFTYSHQYEVKDKVVIAEIGLLSETFSRILPGNFEVFAESLRSYQVMKMLSFS